MNINRRTNAKIVCRMSPIRLTILITDQVLLVLGTYQTEYDYQSY